MSSPISYPTPPWFNGVVTYVPEQCGRISPWEASVQEAQDFDFTDSSYWKDEFLPALVAGLVLGGIALAGCIFFLLWLCVRPFRGRFIHWRRRRVAAKQQCQQDEEAKRDEQFITAAGEAGASSTEPSVAAAAQGHLPWHKCWQRCRQRCPPPQDWWKRHAAYLPVLLPSAAIRDAGEGEGPAVAWAKLGLVVLGLALIGMGIWGLVQSILATDDIISNFWELADDVDEFVLSVYNTSVALSGNISAMQPPLVVLSTEATQLAPLFTRMGSEGAKIYAALLAVEAFDFSQLSTASTAINATVLPVIQDNILPAIDSIYNFRPPSMSIQDTWRFVIIAVLFGLLILIAASATWATFSMKHGQLATFVTALTWLIVALLMLGGVGLLSGVQVVSHDGCLYTESLLMRRAAAISNPTTRVLITNAMNYYFGVSNLTDITGPAVQAGVGQAQASLQPGLASALLAQVLGTNVTIVEALGVVESANSTLYNVLYNGTLLAEAKAAGIAPAAIAEIQELETAMLGFLYSAGALQDLLNRDNVEGLYHRGKIYICCTINGQVHKVWIPWTVAGSLGLVFAALASVRVVWQTVTVPPPPAASKCHRCCAWWCCCWCCFRGTRNSKALVGGEPQLLAGAPSAGSQVSADTEKVAVGPLVLAKEPAVAIDAGSGSDGGGAPPLGPPISSSAQFDWPLTAVGGASSGTDDTTKAAVA